ncbi:hypothetical protein [Bradyrhizobium sp. 188]|nr:hypothetical protein [Bradyrhizobium sp. 188]
MAILILAAGVLALVEGEPAVPTAIAAALAAGAWWLVCHRRR